MVQEKSARFQYIEPRPPARATARCGSGEGLYPTGLAVTFFEGSLPDHYHMSGFVPISTPSLGESILGGCVGMCRLL